MISALKQRNIDYNESLDPDSYSKLTRILKKIVEVSHFSGEEWRILYIRDPSFNAFVTGGTYVVVHSGLMEKLYLDEEIAAVIGHEVAHVAAGHIFEKQSHMIVMGLAGKKSIYRPGYKEAFTNLNEREADKIGVLYAALAGYDPMAASRIWARFAETTSNEWTYFKSHPTDRERKSKTRQYAEKIKSHYVPGQKNQSHKALRVCNALWCRKDKQIKGGEGGGLLSFLESALGAINDNLDAKNEVYRQRAEINRQKLYGGSPPPNALNSYTALRNRVIQCGTPYRGASTDSSSPYPTKIRTTFYRSASGRIVGRYIESRNNRRWSGKLRMIRKVAANRYLFEWANSGIGGRVVFSFSGSGSFTGDWIQTHPRQGRKGLWNGRIF
jgi:hypothetical protein